MKLIYSIFNSTEKLQHYENRVQQSFRRTSQSWAYPLLLIMGILCQANIASAQMGKAIELNGATDYIQAPAGVYFNGDFTVEGWVYPRSYGSLNYCRFFDFGNGAVNGNIALHFGPGGNRLYVVVGSSQSWVDFNGATIPLNQWTHIAATLSGTTASVYVNGMLANSGTVLVPANVSRANCYIGKSNWNEPPTNAKFDEFRIWNVVRTNEQIQDNMNRTLVGTETGLQVYYNMETIAANGQTQTVTDVAAATGGAQNGTTFGTATSPTIASLDANATWANSLDFDGVDDFVSFSNTGITAASGTVEFWMNLDAIGLNQACVDLGGDMFVIVPWSNGYLYFRAGNVQFTTPIPAVGKWRHIAMTWAGNGTTFRGYIDGVEVGTGTQGASAITGALAYIGRNTAGNFSYNGKISDFRVWNTVRTAAEIQNNRYTTVAANSPGLVRYYKLNQGAANSTNTSVTSATDETANAANGTLTNFALTGTNSNWVAKAPTVNTLTKSGITGTTAALGATYPTFVSELEEKGIVYNATGNPTLTNGRKAVSTGNTTGAYSAAATNLKGGTKYYYRGYAYTSNDIAYTSTVDSFTTTYSDLGNALAFDASLGNTFYIGSGLGNNAANPVLNTISTALTLEIWIKPRDYSLQRLVNKQDQNGHCWLLEIYNGNLNFYTNSTTSGSKVINVPVSYIPLNQWTHVAGVYNGSQMVVYINGVAVGTVAQSGALHTSSLYAGVGNAANLGGYYNGAMDELRIWNVARTQAQIQANMDAPISPTSTGLICYFPFDQGVANAPNPSVTIPVEAVSNLPVVYGGIFTFNGNTSNWVSHTDVSFGSPSTAGNNALHFDGTSDYASVTTASTGVWNTFGSAITIETWVNPEAYGSNGTIFTKDNGSGTYSFGLRYEGANLSFFVNGGGSYANVTAPSTLTPLNQWSHIAGVYDGTNMKIYVNGALVGTTAKTGTINNASVHVYMGATPGGSHYKGSLDELRVWNTARTQAEIQSNMNAVAANSTGLVAYYPFNQGVANGTNTSITTAIDASPNGFNGTLQTFTLTGTASNFTTPYYPSANNNALDFDGTNDHVQVAAGNYFNGGNFTVEGWVYPRSNAASQRLLDFGNGPDNNNVLLNISGGGNGHPIFAIISGSTTIGAVNSSINVPLNQWSHIAATLNGNVATLYINGRIAGTTTLSGSLQNVSLSNCYIGRSNWNGDAYFNGRMDEFRIWNVVRTQAQIQANSNTPIPAGTAGLVLYYPFNQGIASGNNTAITTSTSAGSSAAVATLNNFTLTSNTSNFVYGSGLFNSAPDGKPVITNIQAAQATFTSSSAISNGASIQEQGFIYSAGAAIPTMTSGTKVVSASAASGSFTATPTGLTQLQLYTVRSYITTAAGTVLSSPTTFTTTECAIYPNGISMIVGGSNATATWLTGTTGATTYSWRVVNAGSAVGSTAAASGTSNTASLSATGLIPDKSYDLYLMITGGCTGTWSNPRTFSTATDWKNALAFDGINDYVDSGNPSALNALTNGFTVETYIRPASIAGTDMIFNKEASGNGIKLYLVNGVPTAEIFTSSAVTVSATTALTVNQWAHLAATYNGSNLILYVNGVQVATAAQTGNLAVNTGIAYIGRAVAAGTFYNGLLDELRVWNTARSLSDIRTGMASGLAANTSGIILSYSFDQGTANGTNTAITTLTDASVSGVTGTLSGFTLSGNASNWLARAPYLASEPSVSAVSNTGATLNGNLLRTGTGTVTERGFIYSSGVNLTTFATGTKVVASGTGVGGFLAPITGLTLGQAYTFRAYTVSTDGYFLSDTFTFIVDPCATAPALGSIVSSNITATTATFSWPTNIANFDWVVAESGFGVGNPAFSGSSSTGTVTITGLAIGKNYDFFLRGNCGSTQSPWQGAITFQTLAVPTFTTTTPTNDAYIDVNWTLHPLPCLINNGTPYSQGIYVKLTDVGSSQVLLQEPISNLSPFIGEQQPAFNFVAGDSSANFGCTVNNTNNWQTYNSATWTIETWVKGNISTNNAEIFRASLVNDIIFKISGTVISIQKGSTNNNFSTPFPLGKWKHLAFTYNGGTVALYIDGVKKEEKAISNLVFGGGAATYSIANNFKGIEMGEIRYWNRVRTDIEIADNRWQTSFNALTQSNLLLHWRWNANNTNPTDLATAYDGQNNTATYTGIGSLPTLPYITTPSYTPIVGTFRHYVGPTQTRNYKLEVFQIGTGAAIPTCTNLTTNGSTIAFQQPINGTASIDSLNKIRLRWTNKSKLSESFKIFRNGALRTVIAGSGKIDSVFVWDDTYSALDSGSIKNGTAYNYCIETYSNNLGTGYTPQLCRTGNTYNLNFAATDNTSPSSVTMTWANVAAYNYLIQIKRDETLLANLPATATSYTDLTPVYGKVATYQIALIDNASNEIISDSDNGSVPARGIISGRVVTFENDYALKQVRVRLNSLVDSSVHLTTYTDYKGNFSFNNLYYERAGDFELKADYLNHVFIEKLQTITLSDAKYEVKDVVFHDSTGLTMSATPLAVSNFVGTPVNTQDKINFAWNYTPVAGDTVLFDIYREATLIATISSPMNALNYADLGGQPNVSYKYRLNAYKVQNGTITANELADTLVFPSVTMTNGFTATPNTNLGLVNMAWTHTSANYSGFCLYRNGVKVQDIAPGVLSYVDRDAKPATTVTYLLKAKRFVDEITFESFGQTAASIAIPALPPVGTITATANTTRNSVTISWTIPAVLTTSYNYDGFRVYRKTATGTDVYIGQLPKGINPPFEDKTGIPSVSYTYTVKSYLRLPDNSISESVGNSATRAFPVVTAPTALTASTNIVGEVALSWTPPASTVRNIDGQVVLRGTDTLAVLATNTATFRVFTNTATSATYAVRTFRLVEGQRRVSNPITASGKSATASTSPEYATNVKASQNLPNHVRLSWEYPSYVLSTFKIYRNNVLIATMPTESRVYLDNTAVLGTTYLYQVEAINGANIAQKAGAWGSLKSIVELNGMVYSNTDKYGVPGVDVYLLGTNYSAHTRTDSSGFYVFSGLPQTAGTSLNVAIDGYGTSYTSTFSPNNQTFTINSATVYTRNFGSSYTPATTDSIAPTRPMNVMATPIPARRSMAITWNTSNNFYDGFEVYRANILLGTVMKGSSFVVYDTEGYPGINYTYQIRSFQYTDNLKITKKYSNFVVTTGTFPVLESPIFLTATPNLALNTLKLNWSHNWDNHTRYQIKRNDSLLATVNTKTLLEFTDVTGIPGQQYTYSVTAVMVVGATTHYSTEATINVQYPVVAEVGNLTATVPTISTSYTMPCNTNVTQQRNFVDLDWTYNPTALVKGFRVYRNQTLLATLPKDSLHYRDYNGLPGNLHPYTVKTILERNGDNFYSQGVILNQLFPNLATPQQVTSADVLGAKQIAWTYPDGGATAFYIWRNGISIDTVVADSMQQKVFTFKDKTGVSGTSYDYIIKAYSKRNDITYWSDDYSCLTGLVYPKPLSPTNVAASDGTYSSYTKVSWSYPQGTDITAFAIFRNGTQIGTVAGGIKNYFDLTATTTATYSVKAYKTATFQGNTYTNNSDMSATDTGYPGQTTSAYTPTSVTASQGTLNGQTRIDWVAGSSPATIVGFKIYRDGTLLQSVGASDSYFYDANGIAGKHYIYEVCSYTNSGENNRKAAEGWSQPDGYIEGKVVTVIGNGGVAGVSIEAVASIDGNDYIYNATTNTNGEYFMPNLYYGNTISNYTLTANYRDHIFISNPIYTTLSPQQKSRNTMFFNDKTAYVIAGKVGRRDATCYLDSIHVTGEYIMADSSTEMFLQDAYTDANGNYALSMNPYKQNAIGARISIDTTRVLVSSAGSDTLRFRFKALQPTEFNSLANFPQNTTLNFEDTLTYPVRLEVFSACRYPVTGGNFKIRVRSKDDCFDKIYTTDLTGKAIVNLPPLSYVMNVDGAVNNTAANQLVVDYLRYRPQALDVYSLYIDSTYHATSAVLDSLTHQEFIYHRPPSITVLGGFDRYLCDDPTKPAIVKQGMNYSLKFQIGETFNNVPCVSRTGYMVVKNAAATLDRDTIYVNRNTGNVDTYTFMAGNPNLVSPHAHTMTVEYRTDIGELIASKTFAIIVEGSAPLPGADIIVDLGDGDVQLPIFTLRDPYGDASSSSIASGSSITKNFSLSSDFAVSLGLKAELEVKSAPGMKLNLELKGGGGAGGGKAWALTASTTEEISTSGSSWHVGPNHDVIVGAGVALQYGLVQQIKVLGCNNITKTQRLGFSPHSIQTTWHYTVAQIKGLIEEYKSKILQVEAGTLILEEAGQVLSKGAAIQRLSTYQHNWEKIMEYHTKETLPWYNLCQKRASDIPEPYKSQANQWRGGFCPLVGSYDGNGDFQPKDNLVWDQELVTAYNNAMTAIRILQENYMDLSIQELPNWAYYQGALSDPAKFVDEAYVNLHDLQAQNLTYGSGISINKSFESAASSTTTLTGKAFLNFSMWSAIGIKALALAGFIAETQIAEVEAFGGYTIGIDWNFATEQSTARENTNNISYTLSDDDDIDQFSVTAIQGIDPHQTPYFSLLGGRSSCPQEFGTIYRDDPKLLLYDETTQSTSEEGTANFVEPNDPAMFYLQAANLNPFNETRSVSITLDPSTNLDGAKLTIAGTPMIAGQKVIFSLPSDAPVVFPLSVERGLWAYDYEGLRLDIKPACGFVNDENGDNAMIDPTNTSVTLNVHFKNECSPITIAEPDGYWTIQKQNVGNPNSREALPIRLMDYDPSNPNLLNVRLEYRRVGGGSLLWRQIPAAELSPATLQTWNDQNFLASQVPYYTYSWDITGDYATYPDGEYQVRAVAECGLGGRVYSNIIVGAIERNTHLYGLPQPSDHVWTPGDEISVAFNTDIDCAIVEDSNFIVRKLNDPSTFLPGNVACANNKLLFYPDMSILPFFDGDTMQMVIKGVRTFNGNTLDSVLWNFVVISRNFYATKDSFEIELRQGETAKLSTVFVNNTNSGQVLTYTIQGLANTTTWLTTDAASGSILSASPETIAFTIDSKNLPVGVKTLSLDLTANGTTYPNALYFKVNVLPVGPDWTLDPSEYSQNMTLISNFNFNNSNVKSTDTTDLISVWVDNELRGVSNINKFTNTLYSAVIAVYGNPSDFGKQLKFRVWDASAGIEYDARLDGVNQTMTFAPDKVEGSVSVPKLLDVFTASDKVRYIPLNAGWTMFSVNTNNWNVPLNTALSSLRHPHNNDVIKTANKSATYLTTSNTWVSTNGLDSMNVHRGYQIFLQEADTLRITGLAASIRPITLSYGWNFVGYPLQKVQELDSAFSFLGQPDSIVLKTVAQNPTYSDNMVAMYYSNTWKYTSNSDMAQMYPNFAYKMRVSSTGSQLYFEGANASQAPVSLLRLAQSNGTPTPEDADTWFVNPANYEHNLLITASVIIDKEEVNNANTKVAAYVGNECRGVGELKYVPELKRYVMQMFVYTNDVSEQMEFYIYEGDKKRRYAHYETLGFTRDAFVGDMTSPYIFRNTAPDNTFSASVYPNPFENRLKVSLHSDKSQSYTIRLTDLLGHIILEDVIKDSNTNTQYILDTKSIELSDGVYLLQVLGSLGKSTSMKVVHQGN